MDSGKEGNEQKGRDCRRGGKGEEEEERGSGTDGPRRFQKFRTWVRLCLLRSSAVDFVAACLSSASMPWRSVCSCDAEWMHLHEVAPEVDDRRL